MITIDLMKSTNEKEFLDPNRSTRSAWFFDKSYGKDECPDLNVNATGKAMAIISQDNFWIIFIQGTLLFNFNKQVTQKIVSLLLEAYFTAVFFCTTRKWHMRKPSGNLTWRYFCLHTGCTERSFTFVGFLRQWRPGFHCLYPTTRRKENGLPKVTAYILKDSRRRSSGTTPCWSVCRWIPQQQHILQSKTWLLYCNCLAIITPVTGLRRTDCLLFLHSALHETC